MEKYPDMDYMSAYYRIVDVIISHGGPDTSGTVRMVHPRTTVLLVHASQRVGS